MEPVTVLHSTWILFNKRVDVHVFQHYQISIDSPLISLLKPDWPAVWNRGSFYYPFSNLDECLWGPPLYFLTSMNAKVFLKREVSRGGCTFICFYETETAPFTVVTASTMFS
jgi:hypothetical protein